MSKLQDIEAMLASGSAVRIGDGHIKRAAPDRGGGGMSRSTQPAPGGPDFRPSLG